MERLNLAAKKKLSPLRGTSASIVNQILLSSSPSSQWVLGLLFFLFPVASSWIRALYLPFHVFSGLTLLVMAIGTSLLGITEKLLFSIAYVPMVFVFLLFLSKN